MNLQYAIKFYSDVIVPAGTAVELVGEVYVNFPSDNEYHHAQGEGICVRCLTDGRMVVVPADWVADSPPPVSATPVD